MLFAAVIGMDGLPVAQAIKEKGSIDSIASKFTMVMKLVQKSMKGMENLGELEENLVQAGNAWILTRFLNDRYFLCVAMSGPETLENWRIWLNGWPLCTLTMSSAFRSFPKSIDMSR